MEFEMKYFMKCEKSQKFYREFSAETFHVDLTIYKTHLGLSSSLSLWPDMLIDTSFAKIAFPGQVGQRDTVK